MKLEQRSVNDVVILEATGEITYGKGSDVEIRKMVDGLFVAGHRKVVLDVGGITYVDSAGLGQLAQMHATATRHQSVLKLSRVSKRLRDLLVATRLLSLFQIFETEEAALASFDAASPS